MTGQAREMRLRRKAARQGLALSKSRRRDPDALDYGKYALLEPATGRVVFGAGPVGYAADLDAVEAFLTQQP